MIATVKPTAKPINARTNHVPKYRSSHNPKRPGTTISAEMVIMRDAHAAALAIGERSSGGLVTVDIDRVSGHQSNPIKTP